MATVADLLLAFFVVTTVVSVLAVARGVRYFRRLRRRTRSMPTLTADACHRVATAVTDPGWWLSQWDRRRLWRSVVNAERSVRHAKAAGVPTGDLASVTRQLRKAAAVVDAGLRSGRPSRDLQRQANELASAADDVSRAAAAAVASDATPLTERALEAVSLELAALRR